MREYKFRAKSVKTNEWVYGSLLRDEIQKKYYIVDNESGVGKEVDENTIGQYTSLKDKNGVKIYEGDIVNCYNRNFIVEFIKERGGFFPFACGDGCGCCEDEVISSYGLETSAKVIGNIYDNPELLKESDNKCQN